MNAGGVVFTTPVAKLSDTWDVLRGLLIPTPTGTKHLHIQI